MKDLIDRYYNHSPEEIMQLEYMRWINWICSPAFNIHPSQRDYLETLDMALSRHYNAGSYRDFMAAIQTAKEVFDFGDK